MISCGKQENQSTTNIEVPKNIEQEVVKNNDVSNNWEISKVKLDNLEEKASNEESSCKTVWKSYLDNNITNNTEAILSYYETFEINTTESACLVAYKYITEWRHYWNVYDISAWDELYNDSCIPSYDVENDVMTYCSEQDITLKEKDFKEYVEFWIK